MSNQWEEQHDGKLPNKWTIFATAHRLGYRTHSYRHQGQCWYDFFAPNGAIVPTKLNAVRTQTRPPNNKPLGDRIFIEHSGNTLREAAYKVMQELEKRRAEFGLPAAA